MRYRFRGLMRDTGKLVEGHVEAPTSDAAYGVLGDNGVVTEVLVLDPAPRRPGAGPLSSIEPPEPPEAPQHPEAPPQSAQQSAHQAAHQAAAQVRPESPVAGGTAQPGAGAQPNQSDMAQHAWSIADALESAFDTSAQQVSVDKLAERFRGQHVRVIDRDKIRKRVMQLIEQAIDQSSEREESHEETRDRIAAAIEDMFKDNRNLTSQVQHGNASLERQINRLSRVVGGLERAVANMSMVLRSGGGGGGGGTGRLTHDQRSKSQEQEAVLLEIFESNLELRREMDHDETQGETDTAAAEPAGTTATESATATQADNETGSEQNQPSTAT